MVTCSVTVSKPGNPTAFNLNNKQMQELVVAPRLHVQRSQKKLLGL